MTTVTIVGSGPAAAGAALALLRDGRCEVAIMDVGERLESERQVLLDSLVDVRPADWPAGVQSVLSRQPVALSKGELPQKRLFGSDFPFRDVGQLAALSVDFGGNGVTVSGAFGGFSNAWGAQVMPFSRSTFDAWPIGYDTMVPHYRAMLEHIPFAGADDDYSEFFPLLAPADPLPSLAPPAAAVIARYLDRRAAIRRHRVTVGMARLAMDSSRCIECGLCLTGCPYGVIYASSQTLGPLVAKGAVRYREGLLVLRVGEDEHGCWIEARDLRSGSVEKVRTDRVLLACGGIGTTRVVLNSIRRTARRLTLQESAQIVLPFMSLGAYQDPRTYSTFTLNQINMLIEYGRPGLDFAQIHLYPYNPAFVDALPGPVRRTNATLRAILRRTIAGLGYIPSWASPTIEVTAAPRHDDALPAVHLSTGHNPFTRRAVLRTVSRMLAVAPALDLWPIVPAARFSGPGKSYHFGGSFPHAPSGSRPNEFQTDDLGRPREWSRIHLIDASVFPTVAATTFTLTVMANAHRIASAIGKMS